MWLGHTSADPCCGPRPRAQPRLLPRAGSSLVPQHLKAALESRGGQARGRREPGGLRLRPGPRGCRRGGGRGDGDGEGRAGKGAAAGAGSCGRGAALQARAAVWRCWSSLGPSLQRAQALGRNSLVLPGGSIGQEEGDCSGGVPAPPKCCCCTHRRGPGPGLCGATPRCCLLL